jgi:hypothetical protein
MYTNQFHVSVHLGKLIKKFEKTLPEAIRQFKKFDEETDGSLTNRLFTGAHARTPAHVHEYVCSNGEKLDLNKLRSECISPKQEIVKEKGTFAKKGAKKDGINPKGRV